MTLSLGDIIPLGRLKILTSLVGLIGLAFINGPAPFIRLERQRDWREEGWMERDPKVSAPS
jgi:hypothetical protein